MKINNNRLGLCLMLVPCLILFVCFFIDLCFNLSLRKTDGFIYSNTCGLDNWCNITVEFKDQNGEVQRVSQKKYKSDDNPRTGEEVKVYYNKNDSSKFKINGQNEISRDMVMIIFCSIIAIPLVILLFHEKKHNMSIPEVVEELPKPVEPKELEENNPDAVYIPFLNKKLLLDWAYVDNDEEISDEYYHKVRKAIEKLDRDSPAVKELAEALSNWCNWMINVDDFDWRERVENFNYNEKIDYLDYFDADYISVLFYKEYESDVLFAIKSNFTWDYEYDFCWKILNGETIYVGSDGYLDLNPLENDLYLWEHNYVTNYMHLSNETKEKLQKLHDEWYKKP